jgi:hypothetical protein
LGMSVDGLNAFFDKISVTVTWVDLTTTDV